MDQLSKLNTPENLGFDSKALNRIPQRIQEDVAAQKYYDDISKRQTDIEN